VSAKETRFAGLGSLVIETEFEGIHVKGEWSFWHIINGIALRC
jgi:hypothetical protein